MADDILCPTCGHSLAFHHYDYGSCEAPLGGLTSKNMCGCPFTIHMYIQNLQASDTIKKFDELQRNYETSIEEVTKATNIGLEIASRRIAFLELKLRNIAELLDKLDSAENPNSILDRLRLRDQRSEIILETINEIKLELKKDLNNG